MYMDVVEPLDSTENLIEGVVLLCSTDNKFNCTDETFVLNPKEPPVPQYDIVKFQIIKSVVHVVRQKYRNANDLRQID